MTQENIQRINELAHKSKTIGLTDAEKQEQQILRDAYRAALRQNLTNQLDHTYVIDQNGNKHKLKD